MEQVAMQTMLYGLTRTQGVGKCRLAGYLLLHKVECCFFFSHIQLHSSFLNSYNLCSLIISIRIKRWARVNSKDKQLRVTPILSQKEWWVILATRMSAFVVTRSIFSYTSWYMYEIMMFLWQPKWEVINSYRSQALFFIGCGLPQEEGLEIHMRLRSD